MDDITRQSCNTPNQNKRTSLLSTVQSPVPTYCFRERLSLTSDVGNSVLPLRNDSIQENSLTSVCLETTENKVVEDLKNTISVQAPTPEKTLVDNIIGAPLVQKEYNATISPTTKKGESIIAGSVFNTNNEDSNRFSSSSDSFTMTTRSNQFRSDMEDETNFSSCSSNHKIIRQLTPVASRRRLSFSSESSVMSDFSFDVTKERSFSEQKKSQKNHSPFHTVKNLSNTRISGSFSNESVKVPRLSLASLYNHDSSNELAVNSPHVTDKAENSEIALKDQVLQILDSSLLNDKKLGETDNKKSLQEVNNCMSDFNPPQVQLQLKFASRRRTCDKNNESMKKEGTLAGSSINGQQLFTPRTARRTIGPIKVSQGGIWERLENGADRMTPRPQDFNPAEIRLSSNTISSSQQWNCGGCIEEKSQHRKSTMITSLPEPSPHVKHLQEKTSKSYLLKQRATKRQSYASFSSVDRLPPISVEFLETPSHYVSNILIVDGEEEMKAKPLNSLNNSSNNHFLVSNGSRQLQENSVQSLSLTQKNSPIGQTSYYDSTKYPQSYISNDRDKNLDGVMKEKSFEGTVTMSTLENDSGENSESQVPSNNYSVDNLVKQASFQTHAQPQRCISTSGSELIIKQSLDSFLPQDLMQRSSDIASVQSTVALKHKECEGSVISEKAPTLLDSAHRLRKTESSIIDFSLQNTFDEKTYTMKNVPDEAQFKMSPMNSLSRMSTKPYATDSSKVENNTSTEYANRKRFKQQQWLDPKVKVSSKRTTLLPKIVHSPSTPTKSSVSAEHTNNFQGTCSIVNYNQGALKNTQEITTSSVKKVETFSFPENGVDWNTCFAIQRITLNSQYFSPPYITLEQLSQQAFDVALQKSQETENDLSPHLNKGNTKTETVHVGKHLVNGAVNGNDSSEKENFTLHHGSLEDNFTPEHVAALIDWLEKRCLCPEKIPISNNVKLVAILDYLRHDHVSFAAVNTLLM
jgi:hypothetical protein